MDFGRRLRLYLLGMLIGGVMVWLFYGERLLNMGWAPSARIKKRIAATLMRSSTKAERLLAAWPAELREVKAAVPEAEVILKETRRSGDSIFYTLEAPVRARPARFIVAVMERYERDSTATLMHLEPVRSPRAP